MESSAETSNFFIGVEMEGCFQVLLQTFHGVQGNLSGCRHPGWRRDGPDDAKAPGTVRIQLGSDAQRTIRDDRRLKSVPL